MEWYEYEPPRAKAHKCCCCGDEIQGDYIWEIEGRIYCDDCAKKEYRRDNEPVD